MMKMGIYPGIAAAVCAGDLFLKRKVERTVSSGEEKEIKGTPFCIRKVYNRGAALNLLQDQPKLLHSLTTSAVVTVLLYDIFLLHQKGRHLMKFGMMLMTGGAMSNFADRVRRGKVVDYIGIRTRWERVSRITYNVGDFAIFAGAVLAMISGLQQNNQ